MAKPRRPTRVRLPGGIRVSAFDGLEARIVFKQVDAYYQHGIGLQKGAVVVDVGANIGIFALEASRRCGGEIDLYAFEPIPATFELLRANLADAEVDGLKAFPLGLSDHVGEVQFSFFPGMSVISTRYPGGEREALRETIDRRLRFVPRFLRAALVRFIAGRYLMRQEVSCRLETLSNVIRHESIERIDLLKVDVEKAELEVLHGIEDQHWGRIRQVVVEVHDLDGRVEKVKRLLSDHGFGMTVDQEDGMRDFSIYNVYAVRG